VTTAEPTAGPTADTASATPAVHRAESAEKRRQRYSAGVLIILAGTLLLFFLLSTEGRARFALSNAFDAVQLPTLEIPGFVTVAICGVLCVAAGVGYLVRLPGRLPALAATVGGLTFVIGFLAWAASGRDLPFPVSNQLAGTFTVATPLIFGALCGVLCERAGVVNVSIEGQFLVAAFAAAIVGSLTDSVPAALFAAMIGGVGMAALLALFAIRYLVNQVVLGVVLNLLAVGVTGFLFDQLVEPASAQFNSAPVLERIAIPGLSTIPFFGPVLFEQTILAYLAGLAVPVVWFLLFKTGWGLRIRAVGEHPKAADTVGVSVIGIRWSAVLTGGVFAGLGGAFFTLSATGAFSKEFTVGNGFIALAALIMGRWHPGWAAVMALFFGFVTQMASQMQSLSTPVPSQFLLILPSLATIIAVAGLVGRVRAPAADGIPYEK